MRKIVVEEEDVRLMTPGEVARLFRVDTKTVNRWVVEGKLRSLRTPGGHHRFHTADVEALLNAKIAGGE